MKQSLAIAAMLTSAALIGCDNESNHGHPHTSETSAPAGEKAPKSTAAPSDHGHAHGPGGEHLDSATGSGHAAINNMLGTQSAGGFEVSAAHAGALTPGSGAEFDITLKGEGKPKSVRFWIGVESGEGSVKGRPEAEKNGVYHGHAEVPDPMPAGSKFWVEIEPATGPSTKAAFELKP